MNITSNCPRRVLGLDFCIFGRERDDCKEHDLNAVASKRKVDVLDRRPGVSVKFFSPGGLLLGVGAGKTTDSAMIDLPFLTGENL